MQTQELLSSVQTLHPQVKPQIIHYKQKVPMASLLCILPPLCFAAVLSLKRLENMGQTNTNRAHMGLDLKGLAV